MNKDIVSEIREKIKNGEYKLTGKKESYTSIFELVDEKYIFALIITSKTNYMVELVYLLREDIKALQELFGVF